nr:immunoglobulin heavy chain junction region [Homo sapiens]
ILRRLREGPVHHL